MLTAAVWFWARNSWNCALQEHGSGHPEFVCDEEEGVPHETAKATLRFEGTKEATLQDIFESKQCGGRSKLQNKMKCVAHAF
mmetsp:Transcript_27309/g.55898  ORF Transcript_27309/g.55898 Transcript_27309/m.55898 type:complete len:82 (-) Transcript_27309:1608-1853(-)